MKKAGVYILGLLLIAAAAGAIFWAVKDSKNHDDHATAPASTATAKTATTNKACGLFTTADAQSLLGAEAKGGPAGGQSSTDLDVSTCAYTQPTGSGVSLADRKSASLLVRIPKTDKGITSNNNEFGPLKPTTVQDVDGYGDHAYWDAEHGQLNILKNNNWYILSYGPAAPSGRSLEQARQLADLLINKL